MFILTGDHFWRIVVFVSLLHGYIIKADTMDQSYQLYLFILSTTTLSTADIMSMDDISHDWFDAQNHCSGRGLTIERDINGQPYWTGVYRRLSPWINILGCYPDSIKSLHAVAEKTMIISSVGMCQEICYHENSYKFAVKMNKCLCIERNINVIPFKRLPASDCNFECEDKADNIYSGDCGGEGAYNIYKIQRVSFEFPSRETCLSLQCSPGDRKLIPTECSTPLEKICADMTIPDNVDASNWGLSMEHCRNLQPSTYLLGDFNLNKTHLVCHQIVSDVQVFWVGVARQIYTSIDQGWDIKEERMGTILECQICESNGCHFTRCSNSLFGSIFCKSIFNTSTSGNNDTGTSDDLVLKISLPLTLGFIVVSISAVGVLYCTRRLKATKTDRTTKVEMKSEPRKIVDSDVDCVQNNSYFVLEQCPQYISKGSNSSNESPYSNSEEGVYDHLRDKISRKPEVEDTYQHASAGVSRDMSEYDTMANTVNKKQEECDSYGYSHQDSNGNYACDLRAKNNLTDNPYDVAV